jgi:uncharacterized protein YegP (UPF0339 family)
MKFEIYEDKRGEYRWRLIATNAKILADSGEGYNDVNECKIAVERIRGGAAQAIVVVK